MKFDKTVLVAVDFDGTLAQELTENLFAPAIEWTKKIQGAGAKVILWSCREGDILQKAIEACKKQGLVFDYINEGNGLRPDSRKINADIYIDDRAIVGEIDWKSFFQKALLMLKERGMLNVHSDKKN